MIERFEEIEAWQKARELARRIYESTSRGPLAKSFGLRNQLERSAASVMSNIAEGFGRGGDKEFIQMLSIAKGSAHEVKSLLYLAMDADLLAKQDFEEYSDLADQAIRLIGGFMRYLSGSELKGRKYK